jgi:hypothetical protein
MERGIGFHRMRAPDQSLPMWFNPCTAGGDRCSRPGSSPEPPIATANGRTAGSAGEQRRHGLASWDSPGGGLDSPVQRGTAWDAAGQRGTAGEAWRGAHRSIPCTLPPNFSQYHSSLCLRRRWQFPPRTPIQAADCNIGRRDGMSAGGQRRSLQRSMERRRAVQNIDGAAWGGRGQNEAARA